MNSDTMVSPLITPPFQPGPVNPWKGLDAYTEQDREIFFGRERETKAFLRLVKRDILSVLFARPGLGKTSFLRGGVIPLLGKEGFFSVILRLDHSASAPHPSWQIMAETLATAESLGLEVEKAGEFAVASPLEEERETLWEFFNQHKFRSQANHGVMPVLILDPFDEIFTLDPQCPRATEFLIQLADLAEDRMPLRHRRYMEETGESPGGDTGVHNYRVVLSLREGGLPKLDSLRFIMPSVMGNRFGLAGLDRAAGVEIIRRAGGEAVSETVVNRIVRAVAGEHESEEPREQVWSPGTEIEPAYLSVMCHGLFQRMTELGRSEIDPDLVAAEQRNMLDALYKGGFRGLAPKIRCFVEDRLVTASGYRGTVPLAEAARDGISAADLEILVDRRLLCLEVRLGAIHVALFHDLLIPIVQKSRNRRQEAAARDAAQQEETRCQAKLHRKRIRRFKFGTLIILLLTGICCYTIGWRWPHHVYCRSFTKRWGIIHPLGQLPRSAVAHRSWTLRLSSQGWFGKVHRVEVIGANHQLTSKHVISPYLEDAGSGEPHERVSSYESVLDRDGRVVHEVARNRFGEMVWGVVHAPLPGGGAGIPRSTRGTFIGPDGYPRPQGPSPAEFVEIRYDDRGFEAERKYHDREGRPMPGPDHAYGQLREYDGKGQVVRFTSLDKKGEPMNGKAGNASLEFTYDRDGNIIQARGLDTNGAPTRLKGGFHRKNWKYDQWGRQVEQRFFSLSGEPALETLMTGAHCITWEYDNRGNTSQVNLYDQAGNPITAGAELFDFPAHEKRMTYNRQDLLETVAYFDPHDQPGTHWNGLHGYRKEYDERGFPSAISFLDREWQPVSLKNSGIHRIEILNNEFGQPIEKRFFDSGGGPATARDRGCHLVRKKYDRAGHLVEQACFNRENEPAIDLLNGAHGFARKNDRFGKPVLTRFFDRSYQPVKNSQGVHREESTYNDFGLILDRKYYDMENRPCQGPDGVHSIIYTYDFRGLLLQEARYGPGHRPITDRNGIHEIIYDYNHKRQQTKVQFFGRNRRPAENKAGDHIILKEFDTYGREIMLTQLRGDGGPNLDRELGVATWRQILDSQNRWIELAYYDAANHLVKGPQGFAKASIIYHSDTRQEFVLCGTDGKPRFNPLYGYAIKKSDTGKSGVTIESYHGPGGELITGPAGFAEMRRRWDEKGRLVSESWFGPDGSPVEGPSGYHLKKHARVGAVGLIRYFDADNRELISHDPDKRFSVIFIAAIQGSNLPAARAGLQAGDILWRYGNWSYPDLLYRGRTKGTDPETVLQMSIQAFLGERHRLGDGPVPMTVIRRGKPVNLTMPPLPEKTIDMYLDARTVTVGAFEQWTALI